MGGRPQHESPRGKVHVPPLDSPSKQLMLDLVRDLEQVRLFDYELKQAHAYERKLFYDELDEIDRKKEAVHMAALDKAAALHDSLRKEAEAILREHNRAEEAERLRKEEAARLERERIEKEKAEKLRREQEEEARILAERKAAEQARKKAEEDAERARLAAQAEADRLAREKKEKEDAERRKREEEAKKAQQAADEEAKTQAQQKIGGGHLTATEIDIQKRYVEIHKTLKEFRAWLKEEGKKHPSVKQAMGDMRRSIKKSVGQLRDGKGTNKVQTAHIRAELQKAPTVDGPLVDIRKFIAFPPQEIAQSEQNVPALMIYGLNIFAKALVSALLTEASIKPQHAEPVGILAAQIFSGEEFTYKGVHLSDILLAKYRVLCPALWGFTGNEKTESGRRALGWWHEADGGYAAITLRNFGKTNRRNPFPNTMFWVSIQKMLCLPVNEIQDTHFIILQSLLRYSGDRVLGFFGQHGMAVLRKAVVDIPDALPKKSMAVNQLALLKDIYQKELDLWL
ncbi:hypothetical protein N7470_009302 [Penicillium chermesinum]|nr:hypothetical protein N7470_009302 [Penicillium chermesinum]